jgi:type IV secretory pathway TrbD component
MHLAGVGMGDIKSPKLLYFKGFLFFALGVLAAVIVLLLYPDWRLAILLGVMVWAFARAYYFVFYVIEHYVDPQFRFAGLVDFAKYVARRRYQNPDKQNKQ